MPKTRYIRTYKDGVLAGEEPYEVSDAELADEAEAKALAKADELIDAIDSLPKARTFLKRLCTRLIRKGLLP